MSAAQSGRELQIKGNLAEVEARIVEAARKAQRARSEVTLIAVTKTYPASDVAILKSLGINHFGENRNEEGVEKSHIVKGEWHFQGLIQSQKIRAMSQWANWIHSLSDIEHGKKIDRVMQEVRPGEQSKVFLQLSLDGDKQRGGLVEQELQALAESVLGAPSLSLQGLMCVPPVERGAVSAFEEIAEIHQRFIANFPDSPFLSTGMSGDYEVAIAYGATHIRIGSSILGLRA